MILFARIPYCYIIRNPSGGHMPVIELSSMLDPNPSLGLGDAFFDRFAARNQVDVKRLYLAWPDAWNQLAQFGLSSHGADVSEVGSTWLGSFHAMEALRPFSNVEIDSVGGTQRFPPLIGQACQIDQNKQIVGIPWTLDTRVVLYRRDWLQKAGVDETTAFSDTGHFFETLKRLKAAGHPFPLGLATNQKENRLIHDMLCWVWSAGGDIRSEDGRRMQLQEPKSRAGIEAYFGLHEFIVPETRAMLESEVRQAFLDGKLAVAVTGEEAYYTAINDRAYAGLVENLGAARLMKAPFVGGTALVIWRYSAFAREALKLIQALTSKEAGQILYEQYRKTPANMEALELTSLVTDPFYQVVLESLQQGRSVHSGYRWGGVEARLIPVIDQMWKDLHANPELNIACEVEHRFCDICNRLEQTILAWYAA
jgi:ABC-type glycerol-3-phosphate transport system substrate-binding protein